MFGHTTQEWQTTTPEPTLDPARLWSDTAHHTGTSQRVWTEYPNSTKPFHVLSTAHIYKTLSLLTEITKHTKIIEQFLKIFRGI